MENADAWDSAFKGQTPDEMHFGKRSDILKQLNDARMFEKRTKISREPGSNLLQMCTHRVFCADR